MKHETAGLVDLGHFGISEERGFLPSYDPVEGLPQIPALNHRVTLGRNEEEANSKVALLVSETRGTSTLRAKNTVIASYARCLNCAEDTRLKIP